MQKYQNRTTLINRINYICSYMGSDHAEISLSELVNFANDIKDNIIPFESDESRKCFEYFLDDIRNLYRYIATQKID